MDRKKLMYIGIILIVTVILSVTYFSYAFFTNTTEQHGKLNVVVGTLNYKTESNDLTDNAITLAAGESKEIEIKTTSLNDINSKYELYYQSTSNEIEVGYIINTIDQPVGTTTANQSKTITVVAKNPTSSNQTITFGIKSGFINKEIVLDNNQHSITDRYVKITFDSNGGSNVNNQYYEYGSSITNLPVPTYQGYNFAGWYLDTDLTNKISDNYTVTNNITLYANWDQKLLIYENGTQYVPLTLYNVWYNSSNTKQFLTDTIHLASPSNGGGGGVRTTDKIDVTNYSTMHAIIKSGSATANAHGGGGFGLTNMSRNSSYGYYPWDVGFAGINGPVTYNNTELTYDISSRTGNYYVTIYTYNNGDNQDIYVSKIWLD